MKMYLTSPPRTPRHTEMSDDVASTKRTVMNMKSVYTVVVCRLVGALRARRRCAWPLACTAEPRAVECV
jgi:hypothetical protein